MARVLALAVAIAVSLLAVSGAGGAGTQTPKRGGTVVYGGPFVEPACFTIFRPECAAGTSQIPLAIVFGAVLNGAFDVGPDLSWRPRIVSEAEFTRKRPFTVTYHIDPDAVWSDGVPITSRDFIFTVRVARKLGRDDDWFRTKLRRIVAVDVKTVKLFFHERFAGWREFGSVLPAHVLAGADLTTVWRDRIENPKTGAAIGSGPFLVERWERGKQIVLRRNPRFWGPHPAHLDRIVFRFGVQGPALRNEFARGTIDLASHFPPGVLADLGQEAGVRVVSNQQAAGWDHFEFRLGTGGHPALANTLVRRAIAYGIDREAIVRRFVRAADANARQRDSALFPNASPHYRANWSQYRHRPAESRRLLARAGCRRGADGIFLCDGRRLQLRFVTTFIQGGFRPDVLELAKVQLRQVGIEVLTSFTSGGVLFNQLLPSGDFDVVLMSWISTPGATSKPIFGCGGAQNFTGFCGRLVTSDLDQAERILDPVQQARVLNRADRRMASHVPVLPLYQQTQSVAMRTTVRNYGLALNTQLSPLWNAENWWLER